MSDAPAFAIIGATGGIGSELCRQLAAKGARLFVGARSGANLELLMCELREQHGAEVLSFTVNATDSSKVEEFFAKSLEFLGTLDGAVCLAGSILLKPAHLTEDAELAEVMAVNFDSAFYTLRAACKAMMATGGSIVLASSVATKIGLMNHEAIAAAKGAINGLVLSAAATYAPRNIRVNAVAPGLVRTPLSAKLTSSEVALKASIAMHPLGRIGKPEDIASTIAWLLSPSNSWITGQILSIDGGLSSIRSR